MEISQIQFGYVKEGKIYRHGWGGHTDKEIGDVRDEDIEKSAQFFYSRFADLEGKVNEVINKIETTNNKGSFLMKLVHLKEQLPNHDGLGDYQRLFDQIDTCEALIKDIIQKNRERNSEIKFALIEEAKQLENTINWRDATEKARDLKTRWIKTGNAEEDKNNQLEQDFWEHITQFFHRKKQFYEDKLKLTEHRKRKYEELVKESEKLAFIHGKQRFDQVKFLKEQWKEIGGIPSEFYEPLQDRFNKNLKGGLKRKDLKKKDYTTIIDKLETIRKNSSAFNKKEIDQLKKELFKDRTKNDQKNQALELVHLVTERDFILKIALKRFPNFQNLEKEKKAGIMRSILRDLIQRDTEDLKMYEENSMKFVSPDGSMNKLVEGKIKAQKKKIEIKMKLLEWIE